MMETDTIHWFPRHIAEIREFKEIVKAYDYLLNQAAADIQKVFDNEFLETLDADGCLMHERILGITANTLDSIEDRRNRIKGYYASDLPYTEKKLDRALRTMCGKDGFTMIVDASEYKVDIQIRLNSMNLVTNVYEIARKMIPANMVLHVNIIYNVHQRFLSFRHEDLANYTHRQIRMDKIFQQQYNFYGSVGRNRHGELCSYTHMQIFQDAEIGG